MADTCCGVVSDGEATTTACEPSSREARRRRMEIRRFKFVFGVAGPEAPGYHQDSGKRQKLDVARECECAFENCRSDSEKEAAVKLENGKSETKELIISSTSSLNHSYSPSILTASELFPKYGVTSVCGSRRDMEDAVAIRPSFCPKDLEHKAATIAKLHYFGVYDGHGCSHVAVRCRERLHELVKEEVERKPAPILTTSEWKNAMVRSFCRMDKEVIAWNEGVVGANCRCEMQRPKCDAVGSTAVVAILTPDKIIVANCGDSRAVLCCNGKPFPLSSDHKPDRPDELNRIEAAGGRVIYWDGPRVQGFLAMSRAIGNNYLKPYVSCEPEVTIIDRTAEDDCLILATDGLWDVVSNDIACGVARMCLRGKIHAPPCSSAENEVGLALTSGADELSDKACSEASMLLTRLALARHSTDNVSVVVVDLRRDT